MKQEISIEEIKELQLNMLKKIDCFCRDNSIEYSISYGTLIGAIRHGGYIPWDDDIDLMMTRNNYEKFIALFGNEVRDNLKLLTYENNFFGWTKIVDYRTTVSEKPNYNIKDYGVWIDIFPIDKLPDPNSGEGKQIVFFAKTIKRLGQLRGIEWKTFHLQKCSIVKKVIFAWLKLIVSVFSVGYFGKKSNSVVKRFQNENCIFAGNLTDDANSSFFMDINIFNDYSDIPFEGQRTRMIKQYDVFLRNVYGDYMKLPPLEQQISNHHFHAFWKNSK